MEHYLHAHLATIYVKVMKSLKKEVKKLSQPGFCFTAKMYLYVINNIKLASSMLWS